MDAVKTAEAILAHLLTDPKDLADRGACGGKGTGNTKSIVQGIAATGGTMVVADEADAGRAYRGVKPGQVVTLSGIEAGALESNELLRGKPLSLDNGALVALLQGLLAARAREPKPKKKTKTERAA